MKLIKKFAAAAVFLYVVMLVGLWFVMHHPIPFGQVMKHVPDAAFMVIPFKPLWLNARAGTLRVGDPAPDFTLQTPNKKTTVQLSSLRGKPVVLVFGSYS
jgi:AhpC/TSA family